MQPPADIVRCGLPVWRGRPRPRLRGKPVTEQSVHIDPVSVRDPAKSPRSDARDPPGDATFTKVAIFFPKQAQQRPVDIAEAEQTEVVGTNVISLEALRRHDAVGIAG